MLGRVRDSILLWYFRAPEHPMKYRFVRWLGRHVVPESGIPTVAHPGIRLRLHPQDWIEYLLLRGDQYEPFTLSFLSANLRDGDTAVLAGVNFGQHVVVAAKAVGPLGCVVGVEPQPRALLKTWDALKANGVEQRAILVSTALGCREELSQMAWPDVGNAGTASLLDLGAGLFVPVSRLPQVLQAIGVPSVRLMLLDVQGFESNVFAGMEGGPLPDIVVVEIDDQFTVRAGIKPEDLLRQIEELGYQLHALDGSVVTPAMATLPERNVVGVKDGVSVHWSGELKVD